MLTPPRGLAAQGDERIRTYGRHLPLRSAVVFGGVGIGAQKDKLRRGIDILVATPGRLLDLVGQRSADLSRVEILVLDEADRMLDMGFIHDIRKILALLPGKRQNLLFSATYSAEIRGLADRLLHNPAAVEVAARNTAAQSVEQQVYRVEKTDKRALLAHLIDEGQWFQVLVFARTKHGADRLARQLDREGIEAAAIHGDKSQGARTRALADFKSNKLRVLVATDIAARGLDIQRLPHVVNFELPNVPEDYVHRIGRTGRAGESGIAVSLVSPDEAKQLRDIQKVIGREIPAQTLPAGFSAPVEAKAPWEGERKRGPGNGNGDAANRPPRKRRASRRGGEGRAHAGGAASGARAPRTGKAPRAAS